LIVQTRGPVTDANLAQLRLYAVVHGVIRRYNIVAVTPRGVRARISISRLPFVARVEADSLRTLTSVGTWDRDIMDVVDVEETGTVGDPDAREVSQTGAGVHVAMIDTGLIKEWRGFLDPAHVRTDLAISFMGGGAVAEEFVPPDEFNTSNPTNMWERTPMGTASQPRRTSSDSKSAPRWWMASLPAPRSSPSRSSPTGRLSRGHLA